MIATDVKTARATLAIPPRFEDQTAIEIAGFARICNALAPLQRVLDSGRRPH
jgi:hypothetical protein